MTMMTCTIIIDTQEALEHNFRSLKPEMSNLTLKKTKIQEQLTSSNLNSFINHIKSKKNLHHQPWPTINRSTAESHTAYTQSRIN